ncbi:MAG: PDZ domain-containing protein [Nitrospirales bacterium]
MTVQKYFSLPTLFRSIALLGLFLACMFGLGTASFAISPPSNEALPLDTNKSDDPHRSLPSGIVGLALHLTAQRVGDPAQVIIRAVHPSGPAARAGITHGEEIFSVNGQSLGGKTYQEVVSLIRGEIGSSVQLGLRGPQGERTLTVVRVDENILMEQTPQTM